MVEIEHHSQSNRPLIKRQFQLSVIILVSIFNVLFLAITAALPAAIPTAVSPAIPTGSPTAVSSKQSEENLQPPETKKVPHCC
jgi:hypothetical protein